MTDPPPTCAVSLVLRSPLHPDEVMLGVRSPTVSSPRHPDVLSTPTMRIPAGVLTDILADAYGEAPPLPPTGAIHRLPDAEPVRFGGRRDDTPTATFVVEGLFARKLGAADLLVEGHVFGRIVPAALAVDVVPDPATGISELTHMLTLHVELDGGTELLPASTPSYSRFVWVRGDQLGVALEANNPMHLVPDIDLMVCVYGLCIRSAVDIAASNGPIGGDSR